jgi:hypothetical protein
MLANNENYIDEEIIIKFIFPTLGYDEYLTFNYNQIFNECPIVANQCKVEDNVLIKLINNLGNKI